MTDSITPSQKRLRINWIWLAAVLLLCAAAVGAMTWRYQHQSVVTADVYFERSREHMAGNEWSKAAEDLFRYLKFRPDDTKAWVSLTQTYDKSASTYSEKLRSTELHYQVARLARRFKGSGGSE